MQRSHSWTSFDMPQSLRLSQDSVEVSFLYGPEHQRIREVSRKTVGSVTTQRTLNILHPDNEGGLYFEREETSNSVAPGAAIAIAQPLAQNRHYITAENGAFLLITSASAVQAEPVATEQAAAQQRYWHKDHLGSLMAATDGSLQLIERLAYDPFGKRRHINGTADPAGVLEGKSTNRGYTGHEHLDELDVIHMNARVYDPDTGRFLSADPTVPDAANPQAFNRYAYALNNPLSMVDRNGFYAVSTNSFMQSKESGSLSPDGTHGDPYGGDSSLGKGGALGAGPADKSTAHPTPGFKGEDRVQVAIGPAVLVLPAAAVLLMGATQEGQKAIAQTADAVSNALSSAISGAKESVTRAVNTLTTNQNSQADEGQSGQNAAAPTGNNGEKDPSTPTGQRGSPIEVKPGTNEPTNIDGRDYSGHALDRMQGRGVPPSAVEDAIQNGTKSPGNTPGTTVHTGSNGVTAVTGSGGRVVTVISR